MNDEEFPPLSINDAVKRDQERRHGDQSKLWQGCGEIIFCGEEVRNLFNWPGNPPKMTIVDEDGNEVDLSKP